MCDWNKKSFITPNKTKISFEQFDRAKKILALMYGENYKKINFGIYETVTEHGEFIKDNPILVTHGSIGCIIAPRVEQD